MIDIEVDPHELLALRAFVTTFPRPLGEVEDASALAEARRLDGAVPVERSETTRIAIRKLLRAGGFKPAGRSKPCSEYLIRAAGEGGGRLPRINPAVDACNVVALHSGVPASVVDLDLIEPPLAIRIAQPGTAYVFNQSGQTIDVGNLLCLLDARGACANAVKDAQRTKTGPGTRRTLSVLWGSIEIEDTVGRAVAWYRDLVHDLGAETEG